MAFLLSKEAIEGAAAECHPHGCDVGSGGVGALQRPRSCVCGRLANVTMQREQVSDDLKEQQEQREAGGVLDNIGREHKLRHRAVSGRAKGQARRSITHKCTSWRRRTPRSDSLGAADRGMRSSTEMHLAASSLKLWRLSAYNLSRDHSEAVELAGVLQELAPNIQVAIRSPM